jgi:WD40 repeat protein
VREGGRLLDRWLRKARHRLTPAQRSAVLNRFAVEGRPLWLRLAFEESLGWRSSEPPISLPPTLPGLIAVLFNRLARPAEHGQRLLTHTLGLLAASRYGLAETELLDTLSADPVVMAEVRERSHPRWRSELDRLPSVLWAQLWGDLSPYLTERGGAEEPILDFYHHELRSAAAAADQAGADRDRHSQLADTFANRADPAGDRRWAGPVRALNQLPYHLRSAHRWQDLPTVLTDVDFLQRTARDARTVHLGTGTSLHLGVLELQREIAAAGRAGADRMPLADRVVLEALAAALRLDGDVLVRHPGLLWQQLGNRLRWSPDDAARAWANRSTTAQHRAGRRWLEQLLAPDEPAMVRRLLHSDDRVSCCAISRDGRLVAAGGHDGDAHLWDADTGEPLADLRGHAGRVYSCAVSSDGRTILTGDSGGWLRAWTWDGLRATLRAAGRVSSVAVRSVALADGVLVVVTDRRAVRLCDPNNLTVREVLADQGEPWSAACTRAGDLIVVGYGDGSVRTWTRDEMSGWQRRDHPAAHDHSVCCAVDDRGERIVTGAADGVLRLWSRNLVRIGPDLVDTHLSRPPGIVACAVDATMTAAISGVYAGVIQVWDLTAGRSTATVAGHSGYVTDVGMSADGGTAVSAGLDGTVRIWDPTQAAPAGREPYTNTPMTVALGQRSELVCVDAYGTVRGWNLRTGRFGGEFDTCESFCRDAAVSPDGDLIAVVDHNHGIQLWRRSPHVVRLAKWRFPTASTCALVNGTVVVAAAPDGSLRAWSVAGGDELWSTAIAGDAAVLVAEPGGRRLLVGSTSGAVHLLDGPTGHVIRTLRRTGPAVLSCAFGMSGVLAAGTRDGQVLRWDGARVFAAGGGHDDRVLHVSTGPTGYAVASAGQDGRLGLWPSGADRPHWLAGHGGAVRHAAASGGLLLSVGDDKLLRVWSAPYRHPLAEMPLVGRGLLTSVRVDTELATTVFACADDGGTVTAVRLRGDTTV